MCSVSHCPSEQLVVGLQDGKPDHATIFPTDSWQMRHVPTPYPGEKFCYLHVAVAEVFLVAKESRLLYFFNLPSLLSGHILSNLLSDTPVCLFSYEVVKGGVTKAVGMASSKLAVFFNSIRDGAKKGRTCIGHLLERPPLVRQVCSVIVGVASSCGWL